MMPESCEGVWMVETKPAKEPQVIVARAIVAPKDGQIPIHVLNMDCQPVTIFIREPKLHVRKPLTK